ncbi:MAG TPA: hypothetical protein VKF16_00890 [Candidatus Dormibacteraeota bacterium]|nr:hypothetical protein [Candidatus Dormibacteraeota bacterium]
MRERHGYLERLLDDSRSRNSRKARAPQQIAWVSAPSAAPGNETEVADAPLAPRAPRRIVPAEHIATPSTPAATVEHEPNPAPLRALRRTVIETTAIDTELRHPAEANRADVRRSTFSPALVEAAAQPRGRTGVAEPAIEPGAPSARAVPASAMSPLATSDPRSTMLPAAALRALERLAMRSLSAVKPAQTNAPAPPVASGSPVAAAPRKTAPERLPVAAVTPHRHHDEPRRPPGLRIGNIEVTVTAPPPAAAVPPPPQRAPVAPAAAPARLSRLDAGFGLGQA